MLQFWTRSAGLCFGTSRSPDSNAALPFHKTLPRNYVSQEGRGGGLCLKCSQKQSAQKILMDGRKKAEKVEEREWGVERNQESYVAPSTHYNPPTHTNRGAP